MSEVIAFSPVVEQRSPEWFQQRLGKATASRIADVVATTKSGYSTKRANYAAELVTERLTGVQAERYQNDAMRWGTEKEPLAKDALEFYRGYSVEEVGFVPHPKIDQSGASPDGLVGSDGLVEIKCPLQTAIHIETLLKQNVDGGYLTQMQWQMACTGRRWCDYVSFDPRLPANMQLFTKRVLRDDVMIDRLEKEVRSFLAEVDETISKLRSIYG